MSHPCIAARPAYPDGSANPLTSSRTRLARTLHTTVATRNRQRLATRLAAWLAQAHGIRPHETALVPWLARTHCPSNGAALAQWVLDELSGVDPASRADESALLATLSFRLARRLADLAEIQPC